MPTYVDVTDSVFSTKGRERERKRVENAAEP